MKISFRIFIFSLLILVAQAATAGTITVDINAGDNDATDGFCSLAEAMQDAANEAAGVECTGATAAPNTIEFDMGYTITLSVNVAFVVNELTIDGSPGVTIDAGTSGNSIFVLSDANSDFSINDLTLQNAVNSAVRINAATADFAATTVVFDGNTANNGAAINGGDVVTLTNVVFTNNEATGGDGGAINYSGSNLTLTNCIFGNLLDTMSGNIAADRGGGLYINSSAATATYTIINGIFAHNTANGMGGEQGGGAIWTDNSGNTGVAYTILNTQFVNNDAPNGAGGAILLGLNTRLGYPDGIANIGDLSLGGIYRSNFFENTAGGPNTQDGAGGAIFARGRLTVVQSSFIDNSSTNSLGGAINFNGTSSHTLTVANTTFNGNMSDTDGGAIANGTASNVEIINSTIDGNGATNSGGGLFNDNATVGDFTVRNAIISNNAGGNCAGDSVTNSGNNLQFNPNTGCGNTEFTAGDPVLDAPAILAGDNLFVLTMALNDTSAALNAGDNTTCSDLPVFNLDGRGLPTTRPDGQPNCDIGAYESSFDPAVLDLTPDGGLAFGMIQTGMSSGTMTATLTNTGGSDATNVATLFTGEFSAMTDNCNATTIMPGNNCTVDVIFSPTADGMQMGTLTATADGGIMDQINLTGEGFTPAALDLTPDAGLAFGMVQTGTMSAGMTATLTNTGGLTTGNLTLGVGTADFSLSNDMCTGTTLAGGAMCTVDVIANPQTDGAQADTLTAVDAGGPMDSIPLSATGFTPAGLDLTPDGGLSFGNIATGGMSPGMTATLTNTGSVTSGMLTLNVGTAEFSLSNDMCTGNTLAGGAMCTTDVIFNPQSNGAKADTLTAMDAGGPMDSIALSGTGVDPAALDLTPDGGLAFGMVMTGSMSTGMSATLTNTGAVTTGMISLGVGTAEFSLSNDMCSGNTLAAGAMCTSDVIFNPQTDGAKVDMLTAMDAGGPMDAIPLSGTGFTGAALDLTPDAGLAFGMIQTGTSSGTMTATLTNIGGVDATNVATLFTGNFSAMTDNCNGTTVMAGNTCTVDVIFSPPVDGMQMGTLTATADGGLMDQINLTGEGFTPSALDLTPDAGLAFGMVQTGTMSASMTATLTNTGGVMTGMLTLSVGTAEFGLTNDTCTGNTLAGGAMCTVDVLATPQTDGAKVDTLTAIDAGGPMDSIPLSATGFTPAALDLTPDAGLAFGLVQSGSMSAAMTATLTNTGSETTGTLTLSVGTADFSLSNDMCSGSTLAGGAMCTTDVIFNPLTDGAKNDLLTAMDAGGPMDAIALTGTGFTPGALDLTPDGGLAFGNVLTGGMSGAMVATLTNTGGSTTGMLTLSVGTADFQLMNDTCTGNTLMAGAMCTVDAIFSPQMDGIRNDTLAAVDAGGPVDTISLTGTGVPALSLAPGGGLNFGNVVVMTGSTILTATVTNNTGSMINGLMVTITGDFANVGGSCGASLAAGASCTIDVQFNPSALGPLNGTLTVTGGGGEMVAFTLLGSGIPLAPLAIPMLGWPMLIFLTAALLLLGGWRLRRSETSGR